MRTFLEITYKPSELYGKGEVRVVELITRVDGENLSYFRWGVTAIGCSFECADGSALFIHPKSVVKMRQWHEQDVNKETIK